MATHGDYDEELLWSYIESVGLTKECEEFCKTKEAEALKKAKEEPVGDRCFNWQGHYSKYCYELSGDDFYDTSSFNNLCSGQYIPIKFYDPSSRDEAFNKIPDGVEVISLRDMEEISNVTFDEVYERLVDFCDGNIGEGESCYCFDEFGFDVKPSMKQLKDWLEQLRFPANEVEEALESSEFFEEGGF